MEELKKASGFRRCRHHRRHGALTKAQHTAAEALYKQRKHPAAPRADPALHRREVERLSQPARMKAM